MQRTGCVCLAIRDCEGKATLLVSGCLQPNVTKHILLHEIYEVPDLFMQQHSQGANGRHGSYVIVCPSDRQRAVRLVHLPHRVQDSASIVMDLSADSHMND